MNGKKRLMTQNMTGHACLILTMPRSGPRAVVVRWANSSTCVAVIISGSQHGRTGQQAQQNCHRPVSDTALGQQPPSARLSPLAGPCKRRSPPSSCRTRRQAAAQQIRRGARTNKRGCWARGVPCCITTWFILIACISFRKGKSKEGHGICVGVLSYSNPTPIRPSPNS